MGLSSLYLTVKDRRGVRPGSWFNSSWGERSAVRVVPEPWRSKETLLGSSSVVSEVKVMVRSWP